MKESLGSFIVRLSPSYKTGWRLIRKFSIGGKQADKVVPKSAWAALGFSISMTFEEARARAQTLNRLNKVEREKTLRVARIAERVEKDALHHSAFIPQDLNEKFITWLEENVSGIDKIKLHWNTLKKIIIKLQLTPETFAHNKQKIYRHFSHEEFSGHYAKKLLRVLNLYGEFVSRLSGRFYERVPAPRGHAKEMINDAYFDSKSFIGPSEPLTPELLEDLKRNLKEEQYQWLYISLWFGLRPSEVEQVLKDRLQKYWKVEEGETDVLWIYQPKLTGKPRDQRWKLIPVLYPEQKIALGFIYGGGAAKPLAKTLKRYSGIQLTLYAGRKGFTDLMLDKRQKLEDIAQWMGHSQIDTTWKYYKDKRKIHFVK